MTTDRPQLAPYLMTAQIIAGALIAGVLVFLLIVVVALDGLNQPASGQLLSFMGAGFALVAIVLSFVVPAAVGEGTVAAGRRQGMPKQSPLDLALGLFQTKMIIRLALLEGAAFFNVVALMIEHNAWTLGVVAVLVFFMLVGFPMRTQLEHFLENRDLARFESRGDERPE